MIKNTKMLEEFEKQYLKNEVPDFFRNLIIYESLYKEAYALGIFPLKDPLEGLDIKIHTAKVLNVSGTS